jgi:branched-subunit amino acid transport protein
VNDAWITVALLGGATVAIKAAGPVLLGGRTMPPRLASLLELLAPALLSALVVTQVLGNGRSLQIDARLLGLARAAVALWRKAPALLVLALAAAATALLRLVA